MSDRGVILSIGSFDGVHVGHQAILARARQLAQQTGSKVLAMTFDPHPAWTLRPGSEPPLLTGLAQKIERLRAAGADEVVVIEPTPAILGQTAWQFIESLAKQYPVAGIVEGEDFRFGKGRAGDMALLKQWGQRLGFEAVALPRIEVALSDLAVVPVSSTLIRWLIGRGRVLDAARCLGRCHELGGQVVQGQQQGRLLGVPTVNLDPDDYEAFAVPADGVYAGTALTPDGQTHPAAISIGVKPTFSQQRLTVEAHLLDFSGDLYGQRVVLRFARWVRDQWAFPDIKALKEQIDRDILLIRQWHRLGLLGDPESQRLAG